MQGRSPGVHVSEVIHDLATRLGHYEARDEITPEARCMMELGCALEDAVIDRLTRHSPGRYVQPGELELDDIYGTPDLLDIDDYAIEECKLTWMSSNHDPDSEKFWRYWVQLKSYCRMAGSSLGRLRVAFVMGDYKGSGPQYRVWEARFSDDELAENWAMIRTRARSMR